MPAALPPGKTRYPLYWRLCGPQDGLEGCGKSRPRRDSIPGPSSPQQVTIPDHKQKRVQYKGYLLGGKGRWLVALRCVIPVVLVQKQRIFVYYTYSRTQLHFTQQYSRFTTTCFGPTCWPSSGCNLTYRAAIQDAWVVLLGYWDLGGGTRSRCFDSGYRDLGLL